MKLPNPGKPISRALLLSLLLAACGAPEPSDTPPVSADPALSNEAPSDAQRQQVLRFISFGAMGTDVTIEAIGDDAATLDRVLASAEVELRRVEDVMTSWRDSPLTRLNKKAGQGPQPVSAELAELIGRGLAVGELTQGAFDITFASVGKLWDFKAKPPVIPSAETIAEALQAVGYSKVELDLEKLTVALPEGTQLGLGGIAKGYGVDRAMKVLLDAGIQSGVVNAGGDMKVLGTKFGHPWRIAIKHPRVRDEVIAMIPLANTCMVTSGDYERFFEVDGKRYHHILDPRTGSPATGAMSSTVIAPDAAFADALATALAVLEPQVGVQIVEKLPRVECLIVGMDGTIYRSTGLPRER
jgi:FAD:protein FMN transferase